MRIEVYKGLIFHMVKYKEFRRAAEKFRMDEYRQFINLTCRHDDGCLHDNFICVKRIDSNRYMFA